MTGPSLMGLIRNVSLSLQVTGRAVCPVCKVGRLERPAGKSVATCNNCGSRLS